MTSTTRSGPISQPESTAYSAAGRTAVVELRDRAPALDDGEHHHPEQQERQQRPAQEHEARAVEHGQKYDGDGSEAGTGEPRPGSTCAISR